MLFNVDLVASTVTILYVKMPIADFLMYIGLLWGFLKNYWANMRIVEAQLADKGLKEEALKEAKVKARKDWLRSQAKFYFHKIEQVAQETSWKGDDKLVEYIKSFSAGMADCFGSPPSADELAEMKNKAFQYDIDKKITEGKKIKKKREG